MDLNQNHQASLCAESPKLNLAGALQRLRGDRRLLLDLISFFLEDYPQVREELNRAAEQRDQGELLRAAHSLKGLAANFDAHEVVEIAASIERQAKTGDLDTAISQVPRLELALNRLTADLCNYREAQSAT